jgi:signal transduction histidine kinase
MARTLISLEGGNERIVIPAITMHDIGWHSFSYEEELQARGPNALHVPLNHKHEVEGASLAESILAEIGYPEEEKQQIVKIILGHDTRPTPISKEDMIVKDADRLSRYAPENFDLFCKKFGRSEDEFLDFVAPRIERWLFTDSARRLAREFLLKRKLGAPEGSVPEGLTGRLYDLLAKLETQAVRAVISDLEGLVVRATKEKVYAVRKTMEVYLADRTYIDAGELQKDEEFQSIAVQRVGQGGYTGVIDRETGSVIFHPDETVVNLSLEEYRRKARPAEELYGYWDWYKRALQGEEFRSYYRGVNERGEIVDKFQYAVPVHIKNAKWSLVAAASYDEFFGSVDVLSRDIVRAIGDIALEVGRLASLVDERTKELAAKAEELARSNAELELFAHVASHDLQEPLRTVAGCMELLERRYKGRLDENADEFIEFARDGAKRMQRMIDDLLTCARVQTHGKPFQAVDCNHVAGEVMKNLEAAITQHNAAVTWDELPTVTGDHTQLVQLLQNLVGNAIKFHGDQPPRVSVSAKRSGRQWVFSAQDNGIGMEPQYQDRVFQVFQRLHTRDEYPGTGVGLAVCRRIVDRHGGRIWFESELGKGTTFYFTLSEEGPSP